MNKTFASISLNLVGDNNDSTIITFLSFGATRAYLKRILHHVLHDNIIMLMVKNFQNKFYL